MNFSFPISTVWPALLPPCERTTISASSVRTSMIFPFPSSPHWAPTRMVFMVISSKRQTGLVPDAGVGEAGGAHFLAIEEIATVEEKRAQHLLSERRPGER